MRGPYQHDCAPDMFIDILKAFHIKADEWVVKCKVYTFSCPDHPWETATFRMTRDQKRFWKPLEIKP
jgi:hypothetical protein